MFTNIFAGSKKSSKKDKGKKTSGKVREELANRLVDRESFLQTLEDIEESTQSCSLEVSHTSEGILKIFNLLTLLNHFINYN